MLQSIICLFWNKYTLSKECSFLGNVFNISTLNYEFSVTFCYSVSKVIRHFWGISSFLKWKFITYSKWWIWEELYNGILLFILTFISNKMARRWVKMSSEEEKTVTYEWFCEPGCACMLGVGEHDSMWQEEHDLAKPFLRALCKKDQLHYSFNSHV